MNLFMLVVLAYLIGSVPFALVIGKGFYDTDVREHGSRNLGASNSGRVLGKAAGAAVMILDAAKVFLVVILAVCFCEDAAVPLGGFAAAIGHCYPVFAKFKGGKAVAGMYGFLFGLFTFVGYSPWVFFLPLGVFIVILYVTKIISLSSMISAVAVTGYFFLTTDVLHIQLALVVFSLLIIIRHRKNIERMRKHQENKITWM